MNTGDATFKQNKSVKKKSQIWGIAAFAEDLSSLSSAHMVAHSYVYLPF